MLRLTDVAQRHLRRARIPGDRVRAAGARGFLPLKGLDGGGSVAVLPLSIDQLYRDRGQTALSSLRFGAMAPEPLEAEFKEVSEPPERTSKKPGKSVRLIKGGE